MEFGELLDAARWKILSQLALEPSSPVEISQRIGTSVAYVSQQLKLLEAAQLVKKERTGAADKGKPRLVYSITQEMVHFTALLNHTPAKKHMQITPHHKIILRIWSLDNQQLHFQIEKLYWKLEPYLPKIQGILVDTTSSRYTIYVISSEKKIKQILASFLKESQNMLECKLIPNPSSLSKKETALTLIYDPHGHAPTLFSAEVPQ